jgi:hypothetical protein
MRLIIEYQVTDDFTYWYNDTTGVEAESAEHFIVGFEEIVVNPYRYKKDLSHLTYTQDVFYCGKYWNPSDFFVDLPNVYTVDEWFNK